MYSHIMNQMPNNNTPHRLLGMLAPIELKQTLQKCSSEHPKQKFSLTKLARRS